MKARIDLRANSCINSLRFELALNYPEPPGLPQILTGWLLKCWEHVAWQIMACNVIKCLDFLSQLIPGLISLWQYLHSHHVMEHSLRHNDAIKLSIVYEISNSHLPPTKFHYISTCYNELHFT